MSDERTWSNRRRTRRGMLSFASGIGIALAGCLELDERRGDERDDGDDGIDDDDTNDSNDFDDGDDAGNTASDDDGGEEGSGEAAGGWRSEALVDATTGESFSIDEFDRPVLLHTFAIWCGTCQRQHGEFGPLLEGTAEDPVVVELNIDPNEDADAVREHAERHGFDWRFAVSPAHVSEALVEEFGSRVVSAPQSPVILICPDGDTHVLDKVVSATDLADALERRCS